MAQHANRSLKPTVWNIDKKADARLAAKPPVHHEAIPVSNPIKGDDFGNLFGQPFIKGNRIKVLISPYALVPMSGQSTVSIGVNIYISLQCDGHRGKSVMC
jgi:hypothetical protein